MGKTTPVKIVVSIRLTPLSVPGVGVGNVYSIASPVEFWKFEIFGRYIDV
jgi:hypothetical protein